jgi:hypothetical protein
VARDLTKGWLVVVAAGWVVVTLFPCVFCKRFHTRGCRGESMVGVEFDIAKRVCTEQTRVWCFLRAVFYLNFWTTSTRDPNTHYPKMEGWSLPAKVPQRPGGDPFVREAGEVNPSPRTANHSPNPPLIYLVLLPLYGFA